MKNLFAAALVALSFAAGLVAPATASEPVTIDSYCAPDYGH